MILAVLFGLLASYLIARLLYRYTLRKGLLKTKKDQWVNAGLVGAVFFCVSTFVYVLTLMLWH